MKKIYEQQLHWRDQNYRVEAFENGKLDTRTSTRDVKEEEEEGEKNSTNDEDKRRIND